MGDGVSDERKELALKINALRDRIAGIVRDGRRTSEQRAEDILALIENETGVRFGRLLSSGALREAPPTEQLDLEASFGDPVGPAWQRGHFEKADEGEPLVEMACCGFRFSSYHSDDAPDNRKGHVIGGALTYTCPLCPPVEPPAYFCRHGMRTPCVECFGDRNDELAAHGLAARGAAPREPSNAAIDAAWRTYWTGGDCKNLGDSFEHFCAALKDAYAVDWRAPSLSQGVPELAPAPSGPTKCPLCFASAPCASHVCEHPAKARLAVPGGRGDEAMTDELTFSPEESKLGVSSPAPSPEAIFIAAETLVRESAYLYDGTTQSDEELEAREITDTLAWRKLKRLLEFGTSPVSPAPEKGPVDTMAERFAQIRGPAPESEPEEKQ